jgi:pyruvate formate lyase activating enzyme
MTGIITDIHRTSVVDGPGIRTTVFLKGCPLKCLWCHNPETQRHRTQLAFDPEKCSGCGDCVSVCPKAAISIHHEKALVDRANCNDCGECTPVCPSAALFIYGKVVTVDDVMEEVRRDRAYYDATGGGVTLSGGEPMAQPGFALALLRECRQAGIHTALDTTGFMPRSFCESTLEFTSLYLFDYKATGEELHRKLTGVSLQPILETLEFLISNGADVLLRCPLIPGINDQLEHLTAICELEQRYPTLKGIDLLPWHTMGNSKYGRIGKSPAPELPSENVRKETKSRYLEFFASHGSRKVQIAMT